MDLYWGACQMSKRSEYWNCIGTQLELFQIKWLPKLFLFQIPPMDYPLESIIHINGTINQISGNTWYSSLKFELQHLLYYWIIWDVQWNEDILITEADPLRRQGGRIPDPWSQEIFFIITEYTTAHTLTTDKKMFLLRNINEKDCVCIEISWRWQFGNNYIWKFYLERVCCTNSKYSGLKCNLEIWKTIGTSL